MGAGHAMPHPAPGRLPADRPEWCVDPQACFSNPAVPAWPPPLPPGRIAQELVETKLLWAEAQEQIVKLKRSLVKAQASAAGQRRGPARPPRALPCMRRHAQRLRCEC